MNLTWTVNTPDAKVADLILTNKIGDVIKSRGMGNKDCR